MELYILYIVYRYGINRTYMCVCLLSRVGLFAAPWTPWLCEPARLLCPWDSPGKNTGVSFHFLLQGIFLIQGFSSVSCIGRQILYHCVTWEAHIWYTWSIYMNCLSIFLKLYYKGLNCESLGQVQNLQGGLAGWTNSRADVPIHVLKLSDGKNAPRAGEGQPFGLFRPLTDSTGSTHIMEGNWLYSNCSNLSVNFIQTPVTEIPEMTSDQIAGQLVAQPHGLIIRR